MTTTIIRTELRESILQAFERFRSEHPELGATHWEAPHQAELSETERVCMAFLYTNLPYSDLANTDYDFLLRQVTTALAVQAERHAQAPESSATITDELFLLYVLYPRASSEDLDAHREIFAKELLPLVQGQTLTEAALTINYWAHSKAVYGSTDRRTVGPLTMVKRTFGRCGEETAFVVAALRSVGIPARAVFTPRWAHTDDNHAWVEVWTEDGWQYMGACEPEAVLNKGWFTGPAARAALILGQHAPGLERPEEPAIRHTKRHGLVNLTARYAHTSQVTVRVVDGGQPVEGAKVAFRVVNYAEMSPLMTLHTDDTGEVSLELGQSDIYLTVAKDDLTDERIVDLRSGDRTVIVDLAEASGIPAETSGILRAPEPRLIEQEPLDEEQIRVHEERVARGQQQREATRASFVQADEGLKGEKDMGDIKPEANDDPSETDMLAAAFGNSGEIMHFLERGDLPAELDRDARLRLLKQLRYKDYSDVTSDILADHLQAAWPYAEDYADSIFERYVLSPRLEWEAPAAWRGAIANAWTEEEQAGFRADPLSIMRWVEQEIRPLEQLRDESGYARPDATLRLRCGNKVSRKILVMAIARALGIPARLNPVDRTVQVYVDGIWEASQADQEAQAQREAQDEALLKLALGDPSEQMTYASQWTLAKRSEKQWQTQALYGRRFPEDGTPLNVSLEPGAYRLTLAQRAPNGDVAWSSRTLELTPDGIHEHTLTLPALPEPEELHQLEAPVEWPEDKREPGTKALFVLEPGREPTEHIFNELLARRYSIEELQGRFVFATTEDADEEQRTFKQVKQTFPEIARQHLHLDAVHAIMDELKLSHELPLVLVLDEDHMVKLSSAGYLVGTVDQVLRAME